MTHFFARIWARWKYAFLFERDAVKAEIDAAFLESGIPEMDHLIADAVEEVVILEKRSMELENEHEYVKRQERKVVLEKLAERKAAVEQMRGTVSAMRINAQASRSRAAELRARSQFFKQFRWK